MAAVINAAPSPSLALEALFSFYFFYFNLAATSFLLDLFQVLGPPILAAAQGSRLIAIKQK
jgi:hypothetical protein